MHLEYLSLLERLPRLMTLHFPGRFVSTNTWAEGNEERTQ